MPPSSAASPVRDGVRPPLAGGAAVRFLRRLPPTLPGKLRLARFLLRNTPDGPAWIGTKHGEIHVPSLREPVAFHLLVNGVYEPDLLRFVERVLAPGDTFVDVGANVGALTLPASRRVGPGGRVLAVEASAAVLPFLRATLVANGATNVQVAPVAAAGDAGTRAFYAAPDHHFGMGSLTPRFGAAPADVPAAALDDLVAELGPVRLVKLDVEGAEADVLAGAEVLLTGENPPVVVFEFNDWAEADFHPPGTAQQWLLDHGFRVRRLEDALAGRSAYLSAPLTSGGESLVAEVAL